MGGGGGDLTKYHPPALVAPLKLTDQAGHEHWPGGKRTNPLSPPSQARQRRTWISMEIWMRPSRCCCMVSSQTLSRRKCPMIKNSGSLSSCSTRSCQFMSEVAFLFNNSRKEVLEQKVSTILASVNFTRKIKYKVGEGWRTDTADYSSSLVPIPVGGGAPPDWSPARGAGVPRQEGQDGGLQHSEVGTGAVWLCCHRGLEVWNIL